MSGNDCLTEQDIDNMISYVKNLGDRIVDEELC